MKKLIVWSNIDTKELEEFIAGEHPDVGESEKNELMYDYLNLMLDDERINLNVVLDEPILCIADLGLWNGRKQGYKVIQSGNIRDCLSAIGDYTEWYVDNSGNFRCTDIHHDGTNYYEYRTWKPNVSCERRQNLLRKICNGTATRKDITRVTTGIGRKIAEIYGF